MSDTMLDRMARAIFSCLDQASGAAGTDQWKKADGEDRALYRHMAMAALRVLREPTPEISAALNRRWAELQDDSGMGVIPELLWDVMVVEILEEGRSAAADSSAPPEKLASAGLLPQSGLG